MDNKEQQPKKKFNPDEYIGVNERITKFYKKYPEGSIQTEIVKWENGLVIIKASIFRTADDQRPTVDFAYERENSSFINKTSFLENASTSAVGRALAYLGFEVKKAIASKEEMINAIHQQEKLKNQNQKLECNECKKEISAGVAKVSKEKYKKFLCMDCQKKQDKK